MTNVDAIYQSLIHRLQAVSGEIGIGVVNRCIADAGAIKDEANAIAVLRDMSQAAEQLLVQLHGKVVVSRAFTGEEVCRVDRRPDSLFLGSLLPLRRPAVEKVHLMFLKRREPFCDCRSE